MTVIKVLSISFSFLLPISNIVAVIVYNKTNKGYHIAEFLTSAMWIIGIMYIIMFGVISIII